MIALDRKQPSASSGLPISGGCAFLLHRTARGTSAYHSGKEQIDLVTDPVSFAMTIASRSQPGLLSDKFWIREMPVPRKDPWAMFELGLWSMFSMAELVNRPLRSLMKHKTPSS